MQRHQPDHMQTICTSLQTDNHTNTINSRRWRAVMEEVDKRCSEFCVTVGTATRTASILTNSRLNALAVTFSWPSGQEQHQYILQCELPKTPLGPSTTSSMLRCSCHISANTYWCCPRRPRCVFLSAWGGRGVSGSLVSSPTGNWWTRDRESTPDCRLLRHNNQLL